MYYLFINFFFLQVLEDIKINPPLIKVMSAFDGKIYKTPENAKKKLLQQLISPVRWEQVIHSIYKRKFGINYPNTYIFGQNSFQLKKFISFTNEKAAKKAKCYVF